MTSSQKLLLATLRFCQHKLDIVRGKSKRKRHNLDGAWEAIEDIKPEVTYVTGRVSKTGVSLPDGVEVRFPKGAVASTEVREELKKIGFKFSQSNEDARWYIYDSPEVRAFVKEFGEKSTTAFKIPAGEKHTFWAKVRSEKELRFVPAKAPIQVEGTIYATKQEAQEKLGNQLNKAAAEGKVKFKKFFTVKAESGEAGEESAEETEEDGEGGQSNTIPKSKSSNSKQNNTSTYSSPKLIAEKLRNQADALQTTINHKLHPPISQQRLTRRRANIASGMAADGMRLREEQSALYALAQAWESGEMETISRDYSILSKLRYRTEIEELHKCLYFLKRNITLPKYVPTRLEKLGVSTVIEWQELAEALDELIQKWKGNGRQSGNNTSPKQSEELVNLAQEIKEKERGLLNRKITGFYPTPPDLIAAMLEAADLQDGKLTVLEPSAGKGDICEALIRYNQNLVITANEPVKALSEIIDLRSRYLSLSLGLRSPHAFDTFSENDFLEMEPDGLWNIFYDRIVMNPPFENGQDIDHVLHAYEFLKPGGKLVAIMSERPFYRSYKKDTAFREWVYNLSDKGFAIISDKIEGAFSSTQSFNQTGVVVRMITIQKPVNQKVLMPTQLPSINMTESENESESESDNDLMQIELEAQAQMVLLKMRLESAKRNKGLKGIKPYHQFKPHFSNKKLSTAKTALLHIRL